MLEDRINTLNDLGAYFESVSDYPNALKYLYKAKRLRGATKDQLVNTFNYIGYVFWHKSMYDSAFYYHNKALKTIHNNTVSAENEAFTYLMLGNDYYDTGQYEESSKYYFKSLKIADELKNQSLLVKAHNRLSKLFFKLNDIELSQEYANKALKLNVSNSFRDLGDAYNTFGNIYLLKENTDSSLYYFRKTKTNFLQSGDVIGQAIASINLGDTYLKIYEIENKKSHLDSSYKNYQVSLILNSKVENKFGMIYGFWGLADNLFEMKNYTEAHQNYLKALAISNEIGAKSEISSLYFKLHKLFEANGLIDSNLYYLKNHLTLKQQIENSEKSKYLVLQESKYKAEKLIAEEKALIEKERLLEKEKAKWKNIVFVLSVFSVLILGYIAWVSIKRLKIIKEKNNEIEKINATLEIQKREIIDSITYAKRIQKAILPSKNLISNHLSHFFIYYRPKDIVSGDFYWFDKKEDLIYLAVADCTGHGVPGAMMSVVCKNALSLVLKENLLTDAGLFLDQVNIKVQNTLESSDQNFTDGMDISLCIIDKKNGKLNFSGAFNNLYIFTNSIFDEYKGDRQSIGFNNKNKSFTNYNININGGEALYLYTDGYADQFGGKQGKKYMRTRFRNFIKKIHTFTLEEQRELIHNEFENWINTAKAEQIDDVCVLGVKI